MARQLHWMTNRMRKWLEGIKKIVKKRGMVPEEKVERLKRWWGWAWVVFVSWLMGDNYFFRFFGGGEKTMYMRLDWDILWFPDLLISLHDSCELALRQ